MAILGKDSLKRSPLKRKTIQVDELGGQLIVRELNGLGAIAVGQGAMEISEQRQAGKVNPAAAMRWTATTVAYGWINEDGSYVTDSADDILDAWPQPLIEKVAKEIRILSGMEKAKEDDPAPLDEAKKNLTETPNTDSGSV